MAPDYQRAYACDSGVKASPCEARMTGNGARDMSDQEVIIRLRRRWFRFILKCADWIMLAIIAVAALNVILALVDLSFNLKWGYSPAALIFGIGGILLAVLIRRLTKPSTATQTAWLKPRAWYSAWRIGSAIDGYPVYAPPNPHNEIELPVGKAKENFDYFLQQRLTRLRYFRDFMNKFGVDAGTMDDGLAAVSNWFARHGGLLLHFQPRGTASLQAFMNYAPPWTGEHIGINVVWDLGIYIGECVIARRPRAHWDLNTGGPEPLSLEALGFHRPYVSGPGWPPACDPITQVFMDSQSKSREMRLGYGRGVSFGGLIDYVAIWSRGAPPNPTRTKDAKPDSSPTPTPGRA